MKKIITSIALVLFVQAFSYAQHSPNSDLILNNDKKLIWKDLSGTNRGQIMASGNLFKITPMGQGQPLVFGDGTSSNSDTWFGGISGTGAPSNVPLIIKSGGKIGIGINNPSEEVELHVGDAFGEFLLSSERDDDGQNIGRFGFEGRTDTGLEVKYAGLKGGIFESSGSAYIGALYFETYDGGFGQRLTIKGSEIGIGTANPESGLHVWGNSASSGKIIIERSGGNPSLDLTNGTVSTVRMFYDQGNDGLVLQSEGTNRPVVIQDNTGNVGIGTTDPKSKLSVNGQIRSTEVKVLVDVNSVPDYVFEKNYKLRSLDETRQYIAEHKHLPEIQSAQEIGKNGLDLGEMNLKLLKKIEELTLYQIQLLENQRLQNEKIEKLESQIAAFRKEK